MSSIQKINTATRNDVPVFAGSESTSFRVTHMPPNQRIYIYADGVNITAFSTPLISSPMGTAITTNQQGEATGFLYIPSNEGQYKFLTGEILISFGNSPNGIDKCDYLSETILFNHGINVVDTEKGSAISLRATEKFRTSTQGSSSDENLTQQRLDPLSQTFIVDEAIYPLGVTLTSITLYFFNKDATLPVSVELRPVIGGIPSRVEYISGSTVTKYPQDIGIYDPTAGEAPPASFYFTHPIFLKPGEYAFCVITKSDKYQLVTAKTGDGKTVKKPFTGKLFRAQNTDSGSSWISDTNEDLTFTIGKAKFDTGTATFILKSPPVAPIDYNRLRMITSEVILGNTAYVNYRIKTVTAGTRDESEYQEILQGGEPSLETRQEVVEEGDITVEVSMTTKSSDVAPILDRQLMKAQLSRYRATPYSTAISQSELSPTGGQVGSRYVGRIVSLQEGFDSTGIEVTVDVNRQLGSDIEIFVRVLSIDDKVLAGGIVERPWTLLPIATGQTKSFAGTDSLSFAKETYRLLEGGLNYSYSSDIILPTDTQSILSFDTFRYYQVKVVFYAANPYYLPVIKNLTATALL